MMKPHRVIYIVDDDKSMRTSLVRLLDTYGYTTTEYEEPLKFLDEVSDESPACAIVDMKMPSLDGLDVQKRLLKAAITLPIIFVTGHGTIPMTVEAMRDGAVDLLEKPFEESTLIEAIERALSLHGDYRAEKEDRESYFKGLYSLTEREKEVLDLVTKGFINREIADLLGISIKTVKIHRGRVMEKMNVDSLVELVQLKFFAELQ